MQVLIVVAYHSCLSKEQQRVGFQKLCILTAKSSSRVIIINELKDGTKTPDPIGLHVFY